MTMSESAMISVDSPNPLIVTSAKIGTEMMVAMTIGILSAFLILYTWFIFAMLHKNSRIGKGCDVGFYHHDNSSNYRCIMDAVPADYTSNPWTTMFFYVRDGL